MKSWTESNTVRELALVISAAVLTWVLVALNTRTWDLYALGLAVIPPVLGMLNRMRRSDIEAPSALNFLGLNKNNDPLGKK